MNNHLGANIRVYRKNKGFTQEELANLLGVTPQAVSRWESEAGLPDISLVIPIAQILGITTDTLFGYDQLSHDEAITSRILQNVKELNDASDGSGSALRICEYLSEETTKNPTNYEIMVEYVQQVANLSMHVDLCGFLSGQPEKYERLYDDGIRKGIQVIRYSSNHELIDKAHYALAWIYIHRQDYDNAREHINVLPSLASNSVKESIQMELVFFEKGFQEMKDAMADSSKILFGVLGKHLRMLAENYAYYDEKEEALSICDFGEKLLKAYASKKDFINENIYYHTRKMIALHRMIAYTRAGEKQEAENVYQSFLNELKEEGLAADKYHEIVESMNNQIKNYEEC